jgi:hypothetical protein
MSMVYKRRRSRYGASGGFYRFEGPGRRSVYGASDGDFIRLRDQEGREWRGSVEKMADGTIRYRFRDAEGKTVSGISDSYGILLRDEQGNTWRGFVD